MIGFMGNHYHQQQQQRDETTTLSPNSFYGGSSPQTPSSASTNSSVSPNANFNSEKKRDVFQVSVFLFVFFSLLRERNTSEQNLTCLFGFQSQFNVETCQPFGNIFQSLEKPVALDQINHSAHFNPTNNSSNATNNLQR